MINNTNFSLPVTSRIVIILALLLAGSFSCRPNKPEKENKVNKAAVKQSSSDIEMVKIVFNESTFFWIGKYEITQKQYAAVNNQEVNNDYPVVGVSWYQAVEFCNKLSIQKGYKPCYIIDKTRKDPQNTNMFDEMKWHVRSVKDANGYRLPSSKEWEYACRAGTKTKFYWGDERDKETAGKYAVYNNSRLAMIGTKKANQWGLFDMIGNVREWCNDWDQYFPGALKVRIGSDWEIFIDDYLNKGFTENIGAPYNSDDRTGFRVARNNNEQ